MPGITKLKFKKGDIVKVIRKPMYCGDCLRNMCDYIGKIGVVLNPSFGYYNDKIRVWVYPFFHNNCGCFGFTEEDLELVDREKNKVFGIVKFMESIK